MRLNLLLAGDENIRIPFPIPACYSTIYFVVACDVD